MGTGCEMGAQNAALRSSELGTLGLTGPLINQTLIMMVVYKNGNTIQWLQNCSEATPN